MGQKRSPITERLGQQLRLRRQERGLTQEDVGERAGYTGKYISEIERGLRDPALSTIERIAEQGLGCSVHEVLNGLDESKQNPPLPRDESRARLAGAVRALGDDILARPPEAAKRLLAALRAVLELAPRR